MTLIVFTGGTVFPYTPPVYQRSHYTLGAGESLLLGPNAPLTSKVVGGAVYANTPALETHNTKCHATGLTLVAATSDASEVFAFAGPVVVDTAWHDQSTYDAALQNVIHLDSDTVAHVWDILPDMHAGSIVYFWAPVITGTITIPAGATAVFVDPTVDVSGATITGTAYYAVVGDNLPSTPPTLATRQLVTVGVHTGLRWS